MINVGIVGATGYTGEELIDILLGHPEVRITSLSAKIGKAQSIDKLFPRFKGRLSLPCAEPDIKKITRSCDLVFLALPHTVSMQVAPALLKAGKKVIDLSADYRFKNTRVYEKFYQTRHRDKVNLAKAVYGLPELYRAKIKTSRLVANPGCYPTAAILALAPVIAFNLADPGSVIIDAKSGTTGAGKKITQSFLFSEVNEDFKAYKVNMHQHMPEINQELSKLAGKRLSVTFVPHLLPLNRGILETIYIRKKQKSLSVARLPDGQGQAGKNKNQKLITLYKRFYKKEPFVRVREEGEFPRLKDVVGSNFCDIAIQEDKEGVIIIAAIDNLLKGASGQAVQNMNIMNKFPESAGLL